MHLLYLVSSTLIIHASVYCSSVIGQNGQQKNNFLMDEDGLKIRRGGAMGLIPFPRIGRAGSRTWLFDWDDIVDHEQQKRGFNFPRVGRNFQPPISKQTLWDDLQSAYAYQYGNSPRSNADIFQTLEQSMYPAKLDSLYSRAHGDNGRFEDNVSDKRAGRASDGYWFGPRSGRSAKRLVKAAEYADDAAGQEFNSAKVEDQSNSEIHPDNGLERRKRGTIIETRN